MVSITINVSDNAFHADSPAEPESSSIAELRASIAKLREEHDELVAQMGDERQPFQPAKMGGYMSHFMITIEFMVDSPTGRIVSIVSPPAAQTVAWCDPFIYRGPSAGHVVRTPMPTGSTLSDSIAETDFFDRPSEFFEEGKETVWLQILNLDATMDHPEVGKIRIILGETLKREYPDLFLPSLGCAQSLGSRGFPSRLFFNPCAVIETPFGAMRAIHGILSYGRVTAFPPVGTPVSISKMIPLEDVTELRKRVIAGTYSHETSFDRAIARIVALSHPIDNEIQLGGEETFRFVEKLIDQNKNIPASPSSPGRRKSAQAAPVKSRRRTS